MKKTLLYCFFTIFTVTCGFSQTEKAWKKVDGTGNLVLHKAVKRATFPEDYKLFQLDLPTVKQALFSVIGNESKKSEGVVIALPNADGSIEHFRMFEASNFDAELQAQYPEIRAFVGKGIEDAYSQICLSIDPNGIQTMVFRTDKRNEFMEKYTADGSTYAVYKSGRSKGKLPFTCSTDDKAMASEISKTFETNRNSTATLLTFRLAMSCTAEYANFFGATSAAQFNLVLAAYNATMTRVNGIYRKDFAIQMNIVAQSSNVAYYNPATDPYSASAVGTDPNNTNNNLGWNIQLQNTLSSSLTGAATTLAANNAAYDVGHLFGGDGGGGNAGCIGCVCTNDVAGDNKNKGSGYTSPSSAIPQGDTFDIDYVAHELGHQFGGNHTFTHSTENNPANYEPGSGSTIMAYAGITSRDVQSNSDDYFHAISISQIQTNMASKSCQTSVAITHGTPVVNAGANYTIPRSTPFALTGSATDTGGGALTYCWEQYDEAATNAELCGDGTLPGDTDCIPVGTKTAGPVFRSYDPTASPTRYFPNMTSVLAGSTTTTGAEITVEALPSVARALNFRLTVRDNVAAGGQTNFDDVLVTVANIAPLNVTSQNTTGIVYPVASSQTVTWTSAGNSTIAGGANVDILFSNDNGATWAYTLATATTNDGTHTVTLPAGVSGAYCRFMVKANANIFFNVTTKAFAVGDYVYQTQNACTDYVLNLGSIAIPENDQQFTGYGIAVPDIFTLTDTNIKVELTHNDIGSVFVAVRPAHIATGVTQFFNGSCDGTANMNLNFDTSGAVLNCAASTSGANTIPPVAASVTAINGYNGNSGTGTWYIFFTDINLDGNVGTFEKATFNLCKSELVPVLANENFTGLDNFSLYPNPNNGNFTIKFNSNTNNPIDVIAHDIRGRQVYTKSFENNSFFNEEIKLNNIEAGIYIITIQDGDKKEVKKIIVE
ncbi:T9SS type A sorting domain-containing protein [Flavobacterium sp. F372]|uniref:T9SS type A sorting domain-containing protein n=1 Tax=Flavobacterium bernardetii TaxID=2813823 RepID=A0ABR7J1P9_9FLAO|nr:zinc-dependent metalloprotease [Flavobacterium bernardetii]MBC5835842.1 T9SS type A sorting domain-containing protein [Flavobacterium bernardetii]NHF69572.1 T9SS type A sorting domain-containing protein [Flavobacterium bernardetii]